MTRFIAFLLVFLPAAAQAFSPGPLNPAALNEQAPPVYKAKFDTSKGTFVVEVHRDWAPIGADRFYNLVKNGFYDDDRFFRVIQGFMVQFGINGDPKVSALWREARIKDDPVSKATSQLYHLCDRGPEYPHDPGLHQLRRQPALDSQGFAPFGQVVFGMDVVEFALQRLWRRRAARTRARSSRCKPKATRIW